MLCYVMFRQYFVVKRVNVPRQFRHFVLTTKTTQPRPLVFSVNGSITCNQAALLTSF